jgi:energy-coupling factor transporter ATP-binding protein EcfA2
MQLQRFKVTHFRSVVDSGWIETERVTAFIGINESGKTNLLLPLWKLNPARDGEIVPTSDYPKTNYAAVRENPSAFTFIQAEFTLGDLAERVVALTGHDRRQLEMVQVSRNFGGDTDILFPNCVPAQTVEGAEVLILIVDATRELASIPQLAKEGTLKTDMLARLRTAGERTDTQAALSADELAALREELSGVLPEAAASTSSLVPRFKGFLQAVREIEDRLRIEPPHKSKAVCDLITKHLEQEHRNAILLLDEPGLSLHPLAQRDLSAFFEGLAATNQIIYTTHSPFLVDADMLDRARKVYMDADGSTKASADLRRGDEDPRKSGATYAIYSALNMNIAESMLYGCSPVIVEGPSDQHYLTTMKVLLIGKQLISPRRELVFPPAHGASSAKTVASILAARNEEPPFILLDGDEAGRKMARDIMNGPYQSSKERVLSTDKYVGFANSEVEDLVPVAFLADVIDRWERRPDTPFAEFVRPGEPVVPQIEKWFTSNSITPVEGWKVDLSREFKRRALSARVDAFDAETLGRWTELFKVIAPLVVATKPK